MTTSAVTRLAMGTAGIMLAHQVAAKAFRDAAFLTAWPATALPTMTIATSVLIVVAVPLFSKLIARWSPSVAVSAGLLLSALGHLAEWQMSDAGRWVVIVIYLHLAGVSALLLSGFWSLLDERFDPAAARASFGRIAAAGTFGGVLGSIAVERTATLFPANSILLLLAALHVLCAAGISWLGRAPIVVAGQTADSERPALKGLLAAPYIRTIALTVMLTTGASAILDYLLKSQASVAIAPGAPLLRFFALFYGSVQVATFFAQFGASRTIHELGIGRTIAALPGGVSAASAIALAFPVWQVVVVLRAVEAILRGSLYRSGYELLFVPMDAAERRRVKSFLDVTCDRAGEAAGAIIVQLAILASVSLANGALLAMVLVLALLSFGLSGQLDRLYLDVVESQLLKHGEGAPVVVNSEVGWTILHLPSLSKQTSSATQGTSATIQTPQRRADPKLELLADLRSGDRARATSALGSIVAPDRILVAQIVNLLAWDDVVPAARRALEPIASAHLGLLIDALLDPETDFAIRRRLPRILGTVVSERSLDGVMRGLDDARFEVRYHCSRAIDRILLKDSSLRVDPVRMLAVIERELSVPLQVWQGYQLIDRPEADEGSDAGDRAGSASQNFEHIFSLLAAIVPRESLQAAIRGFRSGDRGLRGLALEYLEQKLPPAVLAKFRQLADAS